MKTLTASFPIAAQADLETRTISGLAVPYGPVGYTSWGPTVVEAGSITVADRVVMLVSHDSDRPIGRLAAHEDTEAGLFASFKVAGTTRGDEALLEAAEGIRDGLSVGLEVDEYSIDNATGVVTITRATLREVSQVTFPAFEDARVEKVAASEAAPETPEAVPAEETETEESTVDESTAVVEAAAPAYVPRAKVQDGFPYGPQASHLSFFRDLMHAKTDEEARARAGRAEQLLAAAAVSSDVSEIIPEIYRPDLYVAELNSPRIVVDSFAKRAIDGPNPFRVPKFGSSTGMVADHVEGTNPTDGTLVMDEQVITPAAKSGQYTASREMVEGSNPAVDSIIMAAMMESYIVGSEADAVTALLAGATAGTAITEAGGAFAMAVRGRHIEFNAGGRKRAANVSLAGTELFGALATEVDASDRPMLPDLGPSNAPGTVGNGLLSLNVGGLNTPLVSGLTGGGLVLGVQSDFITFESGLRSWRFEEVDGPANIRFAVFGYLAFAVIRAAGIHKFAWTAAGA